MDVPDPPDPLLIRARAARARLFGHGPNPPRSAVDEAEAEIFAIGEEERRRGYTIRDPDAFNADVYQGRNG